MEEKNVVVEETTETEVQEKKSIFKTLGEKLKSEKAKKVTGTVAKVAAGAVIGFAIAALGKSKDSDDDSDVCDADFEAINDDVSTEESVE